MTVSVKITDWALPEHGPDTRVYHWNRLNYRLHPSVAGWFRDQGMRPPRVRRTTHQFYLCFDREDVATAFVLRWRASHG